MAENDELQKRIRAIYLSALKIPSDQRTEFVVQTCGEDENLRQKVLSQLSQAGELAAAEQFDTPHLLQNSLAETTHSLNRSELLSPRHDLPTIDYHVSGQKTEASHGSRILRLNDYELFLPPIGRGGMGVVYKARQGGLKRIVAVKMIRDGEFASTEDVERFRAEAEAAAQLDHPNIVRVIEVGEALGHHFFSMNFVEGESLAAELSNGPLAPRRAAELLQKVTEAVSYAHSKGVIHRDLKPGNILINQDGEPRVTDFGLAKRLEGGSDLTATGQILGTPGYMPPEQARGDSQLVDQRADIYSLGAVLYATLTGRPPFRSDNYYDTILQVLNEPPAPPRLVNPKIPLDLERICLKCLNKEPSDRFDSARLLADDLGRFLRGEPVHSRPIGWMGRSWRWAKRNRSVAMLASAALAAVFLAVSIGGIAWYFARTAQETGQQAERTKAIAGISDQIEAELQQVNWTRERARSIDKLLETLAELDSERAEQSREHINNSLSDHLMELLRSPSLSEPSLRQQIEAELSILEARDADRSKSIQREYQDRLSRQQTVLHLSPSRGSAESVFPGHEVSLQDDGFSHETLAEDARNVVFTPERALGDVTLEVEFSEDWDQTSEIGLVFGESGYAFVLQPLDKGLSNPTLANPNEQQAFFRMAIERAGQVLRELEFPRPKDNADSFSMVALRRGNLLSFRMNETHSIDVYDYFATAPKERDEFGVIWPKSAGLKLLLASRQITPAVPSPMEAGDRLFTNGSYNEALAFYQEQFNILGDSPAANEAVYKQGLCLVTLNRPAEAKDAFVNVSERATDNLAAAAMCQLIRLYLRLGQVSQADEMLEKLLVTGFSPDDDSLKTAMTLAALMPLEVRNEILDHYRSRAGVNYWRHEPDMVGKQLRALALQDQLQDPYKGWTQLNLIRTYRFTNDESTAITSVHRFLEEYRQGNDGLLDEGFILLLTRELCWMLCLQGRTEEAMSAINKALLDDQGNVRSTQIRLLLERARVYAKQNLWEEARSDVMSFLQAVELGQIEHSAHLTEARLMLGFILQRLNQSSVEETWKGAADRDISSTNAMVFAGGIDMVNFLVASALSGEMSDDEVESFALIIVGPAFNLDAFKFRVMTNLVSIGGLKVSMLRDMWLTQRGRECAFDWTFLQIPFYDHVVLPGRLLVYHIVLETALNGAPTDEQELFTWGFADQILNAISHGELTVNMQFMSIAGLSWSGQNQWPSLSKAFEFDPLLRGSLAYIMACRYRQLGRPEDAATMFESAMKDAPKGSQLDKLIQEALLRGKSNN